MIIISTTVTTLNEQIPLFNRRTSGRYWDENGVTVQISTRQVRETWSSQIYSDENQLLM